MRALLISTYDLGRQPFGLASPAAWLRREGIDVRLRRHREGTARPGRARASCDLVAFHLPMHTATRWRRRSFERVRASNPAARICAYGLYAPLNAEWLRSLGVDDVLGGEFEEELAAIARDLRDRRRAAFARGTSIARRTHERANVERQRLPRLQFLVPDRSGLPPLSRYATLQMRRRHAADRRLHRGAAAAAVISAGTVRSCRSTTGSSGSCSPTSCWPTSRRRWPRAREHITFGDPDFFNGPTHALRIVEALARGASRRHLRRDDQDRASAAPPRAAAAAARHRLPVRDERRRIAGRRVLALLERATRAPISSRRSSCAARRPDARADVRRVSSLADARRLLRSARHDRARSTSSSTSRRFSWRSGCSFRRARACSSSTRCARRPGRSIRRR